MKKSAVGGESVAIELVEDKHQWNRFVDESPYALLFHKWDFLKIVEDHSGYKLLPYGVFRENELVCIFPFFVRSRLGVTTVSSPPPRTAIPYLGFAPGAIFHELSARKSELLLETIAGEIHKALAQLSPNHVSFSTGPDIRDVRAFIWKNYTAHPKFTYVIDLMRSLDDIWSSMSKTARRNVNRTRKLDPVVRQITDVDLLYDALERRFHQQGLQIPLPGVDYLRDLVAALPNNFAVYSLEINGRVVTTALDCKDDKTFYHWLGGVSLRKELAVNEYIGWEQIRQAKSEGFKVFDFVGANTQRLCQFKSKFNSALKPYYYIDKSDQIGKLSEYVYLHLARKRLKPGSQEN